MEHKRAAKVVAQSPTRKRFTKPGPLVAVQLFVTSSYLPEGRITYCPIPPGVLLIPSLTAFFLDQVCSKARWDLLSIRVVDELGLVDHSWIFHSRTAKIRSFKCQQSFGSARLFSPRLVLCGRWWS